MKIMDMAVIAKKALKKLVKKIVYLGGRYQCPVCHSHLRKLNPTGYDFPVLKELQVVGGGFRENSICPVCGSSDRERLIFLYLKQLSCLHKPLTVLHVAPEVNIRQFFEQQDNVEYITADISGQNVAVKMDITEIKFTDNHFDMIICNHVLEHIIDDAKGMSELFRVLKPNGLAILQVPISLTLKETYEDESIISKEARERAFGQDDHVRIYTKKNYISRLIAAGFDLEEFEWWMAEDDYSQCFLLAQETLFLATKP